MPFNLFSRFSAVIILLAMSTTIFAQSKAFDTSYMDTSVAACDNFYRYAVGGWLKNNPIPKCEADHESVVHPKARSSS